MTTQQVSEQLAAAKAASRKMAKLEHKILRNIIHEAADETSNKRSHILAANKQDLAKMSKTDPMYDRLKLDKNRLQNICYDMQVVAEMRTPLSLTLDNRVASSGLYLRKISVPLGVIGVVYESRPNVTFDVFALSIKAGNAVVLKGGKEASNTNQLVVSIMKTVLEKYGVADAVCLLPNDRKFLPELLGAVGKVDVIIPRGGSKLIQFVRDNAKVPTIETGAGIVHTYFDERGDLKIGKNIVENAKTRRVSVCNALDTLIIHESRLSDLPALLKGLDKKHKLQIFADKSSLATLQSKYDKKLLTASRSTHYGTEFLSMKMAIKTVKSIDDAIAHINNYGSGHSEAIISTDEEAIQQFYDEVDAAAVYSNASTAFTDGGQFEMGAEVGISTQKLHARGPMGLTALTTYKWVIEGSGQIRP